MSDEHDPGASRRISKSEAQMGRALAVVETRLDELRRDVARLEGSTGEHAAQVNAAAEKASHALTTAKRALDEARRVIDAPITGPHTIVHNGRNRAVAVGGSAAVGGAGLYALIEFIIERLTQ